MLLAWQGLTLRVRHCGKVGRVRNATSHAAVLPRQRDCSTFTYYTTPMLSTGAVLVRASLPRHVPRLSAPLPRRLISLT